MTFEPNHNTINPPDPREPWPFLTPALVLIGLLAFVGIILQDWSVLGASLAFLMLTWLLVREWKGK